LEALSSVTNKMCSGEQRVMLTKLTPFKANSEVIFDDSFGLLRWRKEKRDFSPVFGVRMISFARRV
jgi:hypothetical protein